MNQKGNAMIRYLSSFLLILAVALAPLLAFAQPSPGLELAIADGIASTPAPSPAFTPIPADADPAALIPLVTPLVQAIERKAYAAATGLVLMILTALGLKFGPGWIPKEYAATAVLAFTALGGFGAAIASGAPVLATAVAFLFVGTTAIAAWEGIFKHVVKAWKARSGVKGVQA